MNQKTKKKNKDNVIAFLNTTFSLSISKLQKGDVCSPFSCPITNTLRDAFPSKWINTDVEYIVMGKQRYILPSDIQQFVRDFDEGKYPELEVI